jgi:hypothetical protein
MLFYIPIYTVIAHLRQWRGRSPLLHPHLTMCYWGRPSVDERTFCESGLLPLPLLHLPVRIPASFATTEITHHRFPFQRHCMIVDVGPPKPSARPSYASISIYGEMRCYSCLCAGGRPFDFMRPIQQSTIISSSQSIVPCRAFQGIVTRLRLLPSLCYDSTG